MRVTKVPSYFSTLFFQVEMTAGTLRPLCAVSAYDDMIDVWTSSGWDGAPVSQMLSIEPRSAKLEMGQVFVSLGRLVH